MTSSSPSSKSPPASGSDQGPRRCGFVVLVGRPNAGKSTLFNALVGQRLSIVTPRPQTTRDRILGVLTRPDCQVIFLDTPGLLEPQDKLHERMERQIETAVRQADVSLLLIDATRPRDRMQLVRAFLTANRAPLVVALNKVDQVEPGCLAGLQGSLAKELGVDRPRAISAQRGDGLEGLLAAVVAALPVGPQLFPDDMVAEQPERFFVAELIREAAGNNLEEELPYALSVTIDTFRDEEEPRKTYIAAAIHVERDSQKGIVIGRQGTRLRAIGSQARQQVEALLGRPVFLDLRVKVRPDWRRRQRDLDEFGYR
jgi:GTPase